MVMIGNKAFLKACWKNMTRLGRPMQIAVRTYSDWSASIMLERVMRAMGAMAVKPSVITGKTRLAAAELNTTQLPVSAASTVNNPVIVRGADNRGPIRPSGGGAQRSW